LIAPEGTRSGDGKLQKGNPGVVLFALRHNIPVYPVVHFGEEEFRKNIRRLKRTDVTMRVGKPFYIDPPEGRVHSETRQEIADEIMDYLAVLLPEGYRGVYAGARGGNYTYLRFGDASDG